MPDNPIFEKVIQIVNGFKTLSITTAVGPVDVNTTQNGKLECSLRNGAQFNVIQTRIDIVDGDIRTLIDPEFLKGDLSKLRSFHDSQVSEGREILTTSITVLKDLATGIGSMIGNYVEKKGP